MEPVAASGRKLSLGKSARSAAAKAGVALPNGKYPIRNRHELSSAIKLRHHSTENYATVKAHIARRAAALGIKLTAAQLASAEEFYGRRTAREQMKRRVSSKSIRGRDPSLRWPHLYDILRAKGYDKEKAARISNSRLRFRKKGKLEGLPWKKADNKKELRKLVSSSNIVAACHSRSCMPPPYGTGGSDSPLSKVSAVVERIRSAGGTPYVVGGYVRDQLLGLGSKDLDIEVHGLDADKVSRTLRQLGKVDEVGKAFGVLKITHGGEDLDISLPRTDSKSGTGHTGFDVSVDPHMGIEAALARRDFTINAIAMDPTTGELVDPYGGAQHLTERRLVAVSEAFSEDPLRVLRGVQFAARFGMTMDEGTAALSRTLESEIADLPLERVWGEFEKIGSKGQDLNAVATVIEQVGLQGRYGNIRPANPDLSGLAGEHRVAVALAAIGVDPVRVGATNAVTQRIQEINSALEFTGSRADSRAFARTLKRSTLADAQRINPDLDFDPAVADGPIAPLISGRDLVAVGMKQSPELGRVLREVTAAQDRGDVTTVEEALELARREGGLVASAIVFACHSQACAPPPVGSGGSKDSAVSRGMASLKRTTPGRGVDAKPEPQAGAEIKQKSIPNLSTERLQRALAHYHDKVHTAGGLKDFDEPRRSLVETGVKIKAISHELMLRGEKHAGCKTCAPNESYPRISHSEARGDSKPVSAAEFQALAQKGQEKLDNLASNASPAKGLDDNWDSVKSSAYGEATQSWGGATIDAHTGEAVAQGANRFALTIKDKGKATVSIPEGASEAEFNQAMDEARERFRPILEREGSHLGVFHDDDLKRIDIDPVLVVDNLEDVHTIGAATRAIGGAYNFADGNGYWPPHVKEGD